MRRIQPMLQASASFQGFVNFRVLDAYAVVRSRAGLPLWRRKWPQSADLLHELIRELETSEDPLSVVGYRSGCSLLERALVSELAEHHRLDAVARVRRVILLSPVQRNIVRWIFIVTMTCLALAAIIGFYVKLTAVQSAVMEGLLVLLGSIPTLLLAGGQFFGWTLTQPPSGGLKDFEERVVRGSKKRDGSWPIPCQRIAAPNLRTADSRDVEELALSVAGPVAHPNVYEVRREEVREVFRPLAPSDIPPDLRDRTKGNHINTFTRRIEFQSFDMTSKDSDVDRWELVLSTSGVIASVEWPNGKNEWLPTEKWDYETNRKKVIFRFQPQRGAAYEMRVEAIGGHGPGNRDAHSHFRADANYEAYRRTLDMRPMLAAGYQFAPGKEPAAWFVAGVLPDAGGERVLDNGVCAKVHQLYDKAERGNLANLSDTPGVFVWEVRDVRNGGLLAYSYDWA